VKTNWDYTALAGAYLKRPDYAETAIDALIARAEVGPGSRAADIGAGVAHLTLMLAKRGLDVCAVEPNYEMRKHGIRRTAHLPAVRWVDVVGEATGLASGAFDIVTFGSSFNVTDRPKALKESARLLKPRSWFACMWNHRDLDDPLQAAIEDVIKARVAGYSYGTRREDQTAMIDASGLFEPVQRIEGTVCHTQTIEDCLEAWRSHATLQRQAGSAFDAVVEAIASVLAEQDKDEIEVPYTTRIWAARLRG
jgi:ubiquinone/menaquinone biosynthesis C-methylase UbiE